MRYESELTVESRVVPGVEFRVRRMSFGRRVELMTRVRELARRVEFLKAGGTGGEEMDAALARSAIDREFVIWGIREVSGLMVDGREADPEMLADAGPEELFREALELVRRETGLSETKRKN